jgi:D-alanyl-D-alanine carboxypeptidase/D-alanyl-D-alanine-endopeptidase (penicillin-binding protein 4)
LPTPPSGLAASVLPSLPVTGSTAPAPTPKGVRAQVGSIVDARALGRSAAIVLDPADSKVLLDVRGDQGLVPGSVVKLTTAAAALALMGPESRIATTVVADDSDTITLVGGGDATLTMGGGPRGTASLAELAEAGSQLKCRLDPSTCATTTRCSPDLASGPTGARTTQPSASPHRSRP